MGSCMRFNVYVDGFNLYYGALRGRPYRWLDIRRLARELLGPGDEVHRVRYFTARVRPLPADPTAPERQAAYIRALRTLPDLSIHYGHFLVSRAIMVRADGRGRVPVLKTEEKGTDVNLATHLLLDAFDQDCEAALVVSNDSDLVEPIRQVRARFDLTVGVVLPIANGGGGRRSRRPSKELADVATFDRRITNTNPRRRLLAECQFPETLTDARGSFTRPPEWA